MCFVLSYHLIITLHHPIIFLWPCHLTVLSLHHIVILSSYLISISYHLVILFYDIIILSYYRINILLSYHLILVSYHDIYISRHNYCVDVQKIYEKPFKTELFLKTAFKHKMFLGQITAKPSLLNYFFAKQWFDCSFAVPGRSGRSRSRSSRNKDMPRYHTDLASRRARTHATQTQTRNTISRLAVSQRTHPPNLRYYKKD